MLTNIKMAQCRSGAQSFPVLERPLNPMAGFPDIAQFFSFYKVINAKAFSERIGMNQSLLAQYISGIKKPSPIQTLPIRKGVQQIGNELA